MNPLNPGEIFAGRFKITGPGVPGSLGTTYICEQLGGAPGNVCLRILYPEVSRAPGFAEAFLEMAGRVKRLRQPGLLKILEADNFSGQWFTVSEYVQGQSLKSWLQNTLSFEERVLSGIEILKKINLEMGGLHDAHQFANLKPQNIFLQGKRAYIKDFWVVPFIPLEIYEISESARAYLPYMAPELKDDWSTLGALTDVYSLGAILYEIFVGKPPLGTYKKPSEVSGLYNSKVDNIVLNFISVDPKGRPQSPSEVQENLNALLTSFIPLSPKIKAAESKVTPGLSAGADRKDPDPSDTGKAEPSPPPPENTGQIFALDDSELSIEEDSETVILRKEEISELEQASGRAASESESETREIPLVHSGSPPVHDPRIEGQFIDEGDIDEAFSLFEAEADSPDLPAGIVEVSVEEAGPNPPGEEAREIVEEIIPPGALRQAESNRDKQDKNGESSMIDDDEELASINHLGGGEGSASREALEETSQLNVNFSRDSEVEEIKVKPIVEEIIPPSRPNASLPLPAANSLEDDDYDPAPMSMAAKLILILVGIAIVGSGIFLGTLEVMPWS